MAQTSSPSNKTGFPCHVACKKAVIKLCLEQVYLTFFNCVNKMRIQANETKLTRYKVLVMDCLVGSSGQKIYFLKKYLSQVSTF